MVWVGIMGRWKTNRIVVGGNLIAQGYINQMLQPEAVPFLQRHVPAILMHDNARPYVAMICGQFLNRNDVNILPWPAMSPDINPVEHIWDYLGRKVQARGNVHNLSAPSTMESPSILETSSSPISEVTTVTDINGQSATHGQIQDKNDNNIRKSAKNCLNFMHLNIHHLFRKFDEIKHYLDNNNTIDILGLGETFLNEKFSDNEFKLHDYQFFCRDRSSNGGGIVLYVKNSCPCIVRDDLQTENTEGMWIEVKLHK